MYARILSRCSSSTSRTFSRSLATSRASSSDSGTNSPPSDSAWTLPGLLLQRLEGAAVQYDPPTHPGADHAHREVDEFVRVAGHLAQRRAPLVLTRPRVVHVQPQRRVPVVRQ